MTDEQIIKVLVDLINRQKAELNALYEIINKQNEEISKLNRKVASRENLEESFLKTTKQFDKRLEKTAKSEHREAIKEFAERLKSRLANLSVQTKTHGRKTTPNYVDDIANQILHDIVPQEIDNLVREMTEVQK